MSAVVHQFERRAREADDPVVRDRAEGILRAKIEARRFAWTNGRDKDNHDGIDVWCWLPNDRQIGVDVKVNRWGEVRVEYVSRWDEGVPGWTVDDRKRSDYILNLWPGHFWLIDFPSLKAVAKANQERYAKFYATREARSEGESSGSTWTTRFIPVPVGILLADIYGRTVIGAPLTPPRRCPSCKEMHPVGTTCAQGWAPWPEAKP